MNKKPVGIEFSLFGRQKGAITMFSAVLILVLLTAMVAYAVQIGVIEQRKSGNELRNKLAFHKADAAIQQAKLFFRANSALVASSDPTLLPDGTPGWLSAGAGLRWHPCSTVSGTAGSHPCFGEPDSALRQNSYFYAVDDDGDGDMVSDSEESEWRLPLNPDALSASTTETAVQYALLCMLEFVPDTEPPEVQGCTTDPAVQDEKYYVLTLLSRGDADCQSDGTACTAEALVSEKVGAFGLVKDKGEPAAPLVSRSTFPPTGTAELVPNPNGSGNGVPLSAWLNTNTSCAGQTPVDPSGGSWATCERHEWYGQDSLPSDSKCPQSNCSCPKDRKRISFAESGEQQIGIDLVADDEFPCDLFEYVFGVPRSRYAEIKANFTVINDCGVLNENSFGLYWFSGNTCQINGNVQVGSAKAPVFLVSAGGNTRFNGGASLFGLLFVTDVENSSAQFNAVGNMTIYGAGIIDGTLGQYQGTFQLVYLESVIEKATGSGGLGTGAGGWTDFHAAWQ